MKAAKEKAESCENVKQETFLVVWVGFPREGLFWLSPGG